jgi:hypothetical protein
MDTAMHASVMKAKKDTATGMCPSFASSPGQVFAWKLQNVVSEGGRPLDVYVKHTCTQPELVRKDSVSAIDNFRERETRTRTESQC